jgi:hypothetical protein
MLELSEQVMPRSSVKIEARNAGIAACVVVLSFLALPSQAQQGPFAGLAGSWAGSGTIGMSNGTRERIRCRASYAVSGGGSSLQLSLRCASDSYRFELNSNVRYAAGDISGNWSEATRGVGGSLSGNASMSDIRARVEGPGFARRPPIGLAPRVEWRHHRSCDYTQPRRRGARPIWKKLTKTGIAADSYSITRPAGLAWRLAGLPPILALPK